MSSHALDTLYAETGEAFFCGIKPTEMIAGDHFFDMRHGYEIGNYKKIDCPICRKGALKALRKYRLDAKKYYLKRSRVLHELEKAWDMTE